jgi:hypothetical protein
MRTAGRRPVGAAEAGYERTTRSLPQVNAGLATSERDLRHK